MNYGYTPLDLLPHAALARYYAYDFLSPRAPRPPRRPSRLRALLGRLLSRLGERLQARTRGGSQPHLQGCG